MELVMPIWIDEPNCQFVGHLSPHYCTIKAIYWSLKSMSSWKGTCNGIVCPFGVCGKACGVLMHAVQVALAYGIGVSSDYRWAINVMDVDASQAPSNMVGREGTNYQGGDSRQPHPRGEQCMNESGIHDMWDMLFWWCEFVDLFLDLYTTLNCDNGINGQSAVLVGLLIPTFCVGHTMPNGWVRIAVCPPPKGEPIPTGVMPCTLTGWITKSLFQYNGSFMEWSCLAMILLSVVSPLNGDAQPRVGQEAR